jgi:hypothetical protein
MVQINVQLNEVIIEHNALHEQLAKTQKGVEMFKTKGCL